MIGLVCVVSLSRERGSEIIHRFKQNPLDVFIGRAMLSSLPISHGSVAYVSSQAAESISLNHSDRATDASYIPLEEWSAWYLSMVLDQYESTWD